MMVRLGWLSRLFYKPSGLWDCNIAFSGMTPVAVNGRPSDATVMAFAAEITLNDLNHVDIVCSLTHFKDRGVANFAFKPDSMEPVRKNNGGHPRFFSVMIQGNVTVLGF
jgi:hypothetical protein